jgi:hypothetical protein
VINVIIKVIVIVIDNTPLKKNSLDLKKKKETMLLISECLVYGDIYTSFHIRKYKIQTHVTSHGPERITNEIPHLKVHLFRNLDKNGIVMLGLG